MFDHLVKVNGLEEVMVHHGLTLPDDLIFIKEQIAGPLDNSVLDSSVRTRVVCCLVQKRYGKASFDMNVTFVFL